MPYLVKTLILTQFLKLINLEFFFIIFQLIEKIFKKKTLHEFSDIIYKSRTRYIVVSTFFLIENESTTL